MHHAAKNAFYDIQLAKKTLINQDERQIYEKKFSNNSFVCHSESILYCALYDSNSEVRKWAVGNIKSYRKRQNSTAPNVVK